MVVDVKTWKRGATSLHTRMKVGEANAQDQDEEVFGKACLWDVGLCLNPGFGLGLRPLDHDTTITDDHNKY
jgi:hypothetical protein